MKGDGTTELREAARFDGGATWIAYPEETMQRASHLLEIDGGTWLVDPVDASDLESLVEEFPPVEGVVVLLDRHKRDSAALARAYDVPVYVPASMDGVVEALDAPTERFSGELGDTGYRAMDVINNRFWQETALWHPDSGTLVVPEAVGTGGYFRTADERLGVHPMLRAIPPRNAFRSISPDRVLVGHGDPVLEDATPALSDALANSRKRLPSLYAGNVRDLVFG